MADADLQIRGGAGGGGGHPDPGKRGGVDLKKKNCSGPLRAPSLVYK